MRTSEAATTSDQVDSMLILFCLLYLVLGIGTIVVMTRMFKRNPVEKELEDRHAEKGGVS
jgi:cytochrome d ubiquinol oxidase subunit I